MSSFCSEEHAHARRADIIIIVMRNIFISLCCYFVKYLLSDNFISVPVYDFETMKSLKSSSVIETGVHSAGIVTASLL